MRRHAADARAGNRPWTRDPWGQRGIVLLIACAAFCLYLYRIEAKSIWWDESLSLYRAQQDVPTILSGRIVYGGVASTDQHPPLYFLLLHASTLLMGESDLALRFPSALFATLLVPLLYAVGARLRNEEAGVIAALIGAASPFVLWYAQEARMYTLVTFLGLLSLYSLWRAVVERRWVWGLAFGLSGSAALATQYLFIPVLAVQVGLGALLWLAARSSSARPVIRWWRPTPGVWGAIGVLSVAVALVGRQALGVMASPAIGREHVALIEMLRDTLNAFSLGATVDPASVLTLNIAFLAVFTAGAVSLWRRPPTDLSGNEGAPPSWATRIAAPVGLLAIILAPVVAMWAYSLLIGPIYMGSRYVIMSSPAFYLGLAAGAEALWRRRRLAGGLLVAGMVAAMGVSDVRYYTHPAYRTKEDHRSAARHVMAHEATGDAVLLTAPENITAFRHYYAGDLPVYPVPSVPLSGQQPPEVIEADLRAVLERGYRRVWLVHCRTQFSDPDDAVTRWLDEHTLLLERTAFPSVGSWATVSAYRPTSPVQENAPPAPALAVYEERLALEGADLTYPDGGGQTVERATTSSPPVPAGRSVTVSLSWRPLAPLGRYKVSLRLLDPQGIARAQVDGLPYMYLPTDEWPLGSVVQQEAYLRIPPGTPPGEYALQMVVYEEEDGRSLAVRRPGSQEEAHTLDLGTVPVARDDVLPTKEGVLPAGIDMPHLAARYSSDLELWAWRVAPEALDPGGRLFLNLLWRARRAPGEDYQLVVNLADEAGRVWHTTTHPLTGVEHAPTRWQAGDLLAGAVAVDLPPDAPPGRHTVHLLVRGPESGEFLWVGRGPWPWTGRALRVGAFTLR